MLTRKHVLLCTFFITMIIFINVPSACAATPADRISGYDRYQTAVAASQKGWPDGSDIAVLTYGDDYPDALSAGPLAHKFDAPILLTGSSDLNPDTAEELLRLKVRKVYIVGGYAVVSKHIESKLSAMHIVAIRLAGDDRYDTALKVAQKVGLSNGVFVALGTDFPDALSAGPVAAANDMPLLLVPPQDLTESEKVFLDRNIIPSSIIIDNPELSDQVIRQFPNYEEINGDDPYERNINLITRFEDNLDFDTLYFATGENFPDALAASALAPKNKNPLLLLKGNTISSQANSFISSNIISQLYIMGGESVISASTEANLADLPPQIASVDNMSDTVQEKQAYEPPKTVTVTTTNGSKAKVPVTWTMTALNAQSAGTYDLEGTIKNFSQKVHLSLTVTPVWNRITAEVIQNGHYEFPTTVDAILKDHTVKTLPVTWDITTVDLSKVGTYKFEGTVPDLTQKVSLILKVTADSELEIPDAALKQIIYQRINKAPGSIIYKSDVLGITDLYAVNSGITDLSGLEYFTNLKSLYLSKNKLSNLNRLAKLTNLTHLDLRNCGIDDVSPLKGLTSLTFLDVAVNNIDDFTPLEELTTLRSLYLSGNLTRDYSPVKAYYNYLTEKDFNL
ncbi:cell wall-binding protein [Desulfosporosinus acidiphilus SJ4]|uniref:Cell wall-binding protein n=1 Tax=Desulfosporosinus acidiphilus (strain DSM 22704 / JCM 16185 / SJ4) TaxID=646529 RepID=I4D957_DESAJ|nr:cell wall-binding repeat-containing protein [Desulfosporosinus acidiphilus]AFM42331.1 cell wall-binding protein [Desulfosporosinus acidiphilus SJ4]